jgi:hypothetical protein
VTVATAADVRTRLRETGGPEPIARAIGVPVRDWAHKCHQISLAIIRLGIFGDQARVARGTCRGVRGQHSWIAPTGDCYDPMAPILDPTLWSYVPGTPTLLVTTLRGAHEHRPHGHGSIWDYGKPTSTGGEPVALTPSTPLSDEAARFLDLLGPLDRRGWLMLANAPVGGWPAGEILAAIDDTEALTALVPIDRLGMLTDRNPSGLYR